MKILNILDFNECDTGATEGVDPCGTDGEAECMNSVGGFQCVCPPGWKTVDGGKRCEGRKNTLTSLKILSLTFNATN